MHYILSKTQCYTDQKEKKNVEHIAENDAPWCPECGPTCPLHGTVEKDAPLTAREVGAAYRVVRAAKDRRCGDGNANYPLPCPRTIRKGEQYVRAVQFKNHDVYSWIDPVTRRPLTRPMVTDMCFECAGQYHTTGLLVIDAQRRATRVFPSAKTEETK